MTQTADIPGGEPTVYLIHFDVGPANSGAGTGSFGLDVLDLVHRGQRRVIGTVPPARSAKGSRSSSRSWWSRPSACGYPVLDEDVVRLHPFMRRHLGVQGDYSFLLPALDGRLRELRDPTEGQDEAEDEEEG